MAAMTETLPHAASLPSIDELDMSHSLTSCQTKNGSPSNDGGCHQRVATDFAAVGGQYNNNNTFPSVKTKRHSFSRVTTISSIFSAGGDGPSSSPSSQRSTSSAVGPATAALNTKLLQNMMRSHKNRDPYKDYLVLDMIGKGSIGSVEKVVRRHHSVIPHDGGNSDDDRGGFCARGGIFNSCCGTANRRSGKEPRGGFLSKLFNNHQSRAPKDAFEPAAPQLTNIDNPNQQLDGSISIVSESSAFSAPSSPVVRRKIPSSSDPEIRSSSQHDGRTSSVHSLENVRANGRRRHHPQSTHPLRRYALKSIRLSRRDGHGVSSADEAELRNEIAILRSLDHPGIVHIIETYECRGNIYMVIDLCEHGDLYVWDPYAEGEARAIARQLLQAVAYMHHRGIVHRDLKYENVMFTDRDRSKLEIKLIDFGLSKKYGKSKGVPDMSNPMTDFVGTIYTMAPEVIRGNYTYKCDIWSIGVMAYMLLSSQLPFCGKDIKSISKRIMWGNYSFSGRRWSKISKKGRDFISSLLVLKASARPTADQALKHPWLAGGTLSFGKASLHRRHSSESVGGSVFSSLQSPPPKPFSSQICTSIERYSNYSWMHRLALMVIAYRYTGDETTHLRRIFSSYDVDDSGTVEVDELRSAFALHGKYSEEEIDQIFLAMDMTGCGKITWTEFLASTIETKGHISEEEFASAFEHLDFDKNGYISTSDLREIIGRDLSQNILDQIIDESDRIGDHKVWKVEFLALAKESTAVSDVDHQRTQRICLKRSKSADDFDLAKTKSLDGMRSDPDVPDQFCIEKAKSVRKATRFA